MDQPKQSQVAQAVAGALTAVETAAQVRQQYEERLAAQEVGVNAMLAELEGQRNTFGVRCANLAADVAHARKALEEAQAKLANQDAMVVRLSQGVDAAGKEIAELRAKLESLTAKTVSGESSPA